VAALTGRLTASSPGLAPAGRVRCLVRDEAQMASLRLEFPDVECVLGDVTAGPSLDPFFRHSEDATVFHTAGVIHPRHVRDFYQINTNGTANMLAAARQAAVRRFVHVSSNSPFGANTRERPLFDETTPYSPYMNYGRSKMLAEMEVARAAEAGGLATTIVRAPWFYGPGQPPRQVTFFRMIRAGRLPLPGGGKNVRSMAYVDNLCLGLQLAAAAPIASGQAYWIADPRPYPMLEVVKTVSEVLAADFGIPVRGSALRLPSIVSDVARLADSLLQRLGLYSEKIHVLSEMSLSIACSVDKAERELGYRPTIGLREGMRLGIADLLASGVRI
jgi:nucleoside-diphosphate-sugar epimerase